MCDMLLDHPSLQYSYSFNAGPVPIAAANYMLQSQGVDVVFGPAGSAGEVAINASALQGAHVIGVDVDQCVGVVVKEGLEERGSS